METTLTQLLQLRPGEKAAVVGCGGKTSVIELLAQQNSAGSVLVAPTTKIRLPGREGAVVCTTADACLAHTPRAGIQYAGLANPATQKLEALPPAALAKVVEKGYGLTLLEADGSRGLPCKGWLATEPVVPPFVTRTVGVVTVWALGRPATEETVCRLPHFLALTGLAEGQPITLAALAAMVGAPGGMFKNRRGAACLIVNQLENEESRRRAALLLALVEQTYPGAIECCLFGSVRKNRWSRQR
ncbi:MAG: selenium cofactor biosynthesis protein YqeC [Oscillospiraceae bacterium]